MFHAYPGERRDLQWVTVTLTSIATILLISRISLTIKNRGWLGLEDGFVIAANVCLIVFAVCVYIATLHGFGMPKAAIPKFGGNYIEAMKFFWLTQLFYTLTNGFNKMAFVALYYRVFPMKRFRQVCLFLGGVSVAWTVSFVFIVVFQCTPIHRVFNRTIPGTCINFFWHRWLNAISNLLTDIAIFIMPIPVIIRLNMSLGSRIGLVVLFSMGFFICLTTALRMATLPLTLRTKDPSWESAPTNLWSFIEAASGVICACLISLRKSITALWPKRWTSSKGTSGAYRQYDHNTPSAQGAPRSRGRTADNAYHSYAMSNVKGNTGRSDTYVNGSPSESQEHIIEQSKTTTHHVMTSRPRSSDSGSDKTEVQGITVTTDVKVIRN
ncbi:hypothetical protein ACJQWK_08301 [Exserohilum turcicum]